MSVARCCCGAVPPTVPTGLATQVYTTHNYSGLENYFVNLAGPSSNGFLVGKRVLPTGHADSFGDDLNTANVNTYIRGRSCPIPPGATVTQADLRCWLTDMDGDGATSILGSVNPHLSEVAYFSNLLFGVFGDLSIRVSAELSLNPTAPDLAANPDNEVSPAARPRTTAFVDRTWSYGETDFLGQQYTVFSLVPIFQELVNQTGWQAENDFILFLEMQDSLSDDYNGVYFPNSPSNWNQQVFPANYPNRVPNAQSSLVIDFDWN